MQEYYTERLQPEMIVKTLNGGKDTDFNFEQSPEGNPLIAGLRCPSSSGGSSSCGSGWYSKVLVWDNFYLPLQPY